MRRYVDFDTCTLQALKCVSAQLGVPLEASDERSLLLAYLSLPVFPDVGPGLDGLRSSGHRLVALTNGTERSVRALLEKARVDAYFEAILSVERVSTFKPDPAVYALLSEIAGERNRQALLVSANPFDVIGAKAYGLRAAWLRRDPRRIFDPWEYSPDLIVATLEELSRLPL